jgi:hypothetical protein
MNKWKQFSYRNLSLYFAYTRTPISPEGGVVIFFHDRKNHSSAWGIRLIIAPQAA